MFILQYVFSDMKKQLGMFTKIAIEWLHLSQDILESETFF